MDASKVSKKNDDGSKNTDFDHFCYGKKLAMVIFSCIHDRRLSLNPFRNVKPIASIHDHASTTVKLLLTRTGAQRTPSTSFPSVSRTSKTHKMNLLAPMIPLFIL